MVVEQGIGEVPVEKNGGSVTDKSDGIMSGKEMGESVSASEKGNSFLSMEKKSDQLDCSVDTEETDLVSSSVRVDTSIGNGEAGVDLVPKMEVDSVGDLSVPYGDNEMRDGSELVGCKVGEECADGDADTGTCTNGEGGRARKRRKVEGSDKNDEVESTDRTNCTGDNNNQGHVSSLDYLGCAEDSLQSSVETKMEEENGSEESDHMERDGSNINVSVKHPTDKNKASSVGRERKRRMGESSVCDDSDSTPVKKVKGKPSLMAKLKLLAGY